MEDKKTGATLGHGGEKGGDGKEGILPVGGKLAEVGDLKKYLKMYGNVFYVLFSKLEPAIRHFHSSLCVTAPCYRYCYLLALSTERLALNLDTKTSSHLW